MSSLQLVTQPLIDHKMSILRAVETPSPQFRQSLREMSWLLGFAGMAHLKTVETSLTTPLEQMQARQLAGPCHPGRTEPDRQKSGNFQPRAGPPWT